MSPKKKNSHVLGGCQIDWLQMMLRWAFWVTAALKEVVPFLASPGVICYAHSLGTFPEDLWTWDYCWTCWHGCLGIAILSRSSLQLQSTRIWSAWDVPKQDLHYLAPLGWCLSSWKETSWSRVLTALFAVGCAQLRYALWYLCAALSPWKWPPALPVQLATTRKWAVEKLCTVLPRFRTRARDQDSILPVSKIMHDFTFSPVAYNLGVINIRSSICGDLEIRK